jgi:hypothetical protein
MPTSPAATTTTTPAHGRPELDHTAHVSNHRQTRRQRTVESAGHHG